MPRIFCFSVLIIVILSVNSVNALAQDEILSHYTKGKMVEISYLLAGKEHEKCSSESKPYAGTVSAIQFTEGLQINNFILKTAKGNVKIFLSPMLYERISKADANALPTLIGKGRRITVDAFRCGDSRKILMAEYIIAGIHLDRLG